MAVLSTLTSYLDRQHLHSPASLTFFLGVPVFGGFLSSFTMGNATNTWYKTDLIKPSWTPPSWLFPPMWTFLYSTMGYSAHRIFHLVPPSKARQLGLALYSTQLAMNMMFTPLFFKYQQFGLSTALIGSLLCAVGGTGYLFYDLDRVSGALLVPYFCWVGYASSLTFFIWNKNPKFRFRKMNNSDKKR